MQPWNNIDLPDPVGKTPITSWPFRIDSKHFTKIFNIKRWKNTLLWENPTRRSTDKNAGLPAIFGVLFIVCDRMLIYYTHKFWAFGGHVTGRCLFPPHLQSQGKAPWGRGCERWTPRIHESPRELARHSEAKRKQTPQREANVCRRRRRMQSFINCTGHLIMHRTPNTNSGCVLVRKKSSI